MAASALELQKKQVAGDAQYHNFVYVQAGRREIKEGKIVLLFETKASLRVAERGSGRSWWQFERAHDS